MSIFLDGRGKLWGQWIFITARTVGEILRGVSDVRVNLDHDAFEIGRGVPNRLYNP